MQWTVYGKIKQGTSAGITEQYSYDARNDRILKTVQLGGITCKQYYIRDAQGNVLAVYTYDGSTLKWAEQDLYGSSRVGLWSWNNTIPTRVMLPQSETDTLSNWYQLGSRDYELTNHLGNVLSVITDKKVGVSSGGSIVDYYKAEVLSQTDYYPFGMEEPGRSMSAIPYPYAFNGKRMENVELYTSNQYDYGMRYYDARVGRFYSVDPLTAKYPELSPYQFASNTPIQAVDFDGLESQVPNGGYSDPRQLLYEAGGDISLAFGGIVDKISAKIEVGVTTFKNLFSTKNNATQVSLENTTKYSASASGNFTNYLNYIMQHNSNFGAPPPVVFEASKKEVQAIITKVKVGNASVTENVSIDNFGLIKRKTTFSLKLWVEDVPTTFSLSQGQSVEDKSTSFKVAPTLSLFGNEADVNGGFKLIQNNKGENRVNINIGGNLKLGKETGVKLFGSGALQFQQ